MHALRTSQGTNTVMFMDATKCLILLGSLSFYPLPNKGMAFTWTALSPLVLGDPDITIVNMY